MEVHAAHGAVVLVEAVDKRAHAVVPELNHAAVQRRQDPWPPRVEGQALHPVALRLELGEASGGRPAPRFVLRLAFVNMVPTRRRLADAL